MVIYIVSFVLSFILMVISEFLYKYNKILGGIGYAVSILPTAIIAGIRDFSKGIDIFTYGNKIFNDAALFGFQYSLNVNERWGEPGYVFLNFLISRFTNNPHWFYFILSFLASYLVYIVFRKFASELYVPFALLLYNFFVYILCLGILRQGLAISILAFSFYFFYKNRPLVAGGFGIIAYLFHDSTILIFLVYLLLYLYLSFVKKTYTNIMLLTITAFFCAYLFSLIIVRLPPEIFTLVDDKYYYIASSINLDKISFARGIIFFFPVIYYWKTIEARFPVEKENMFLYLVILVNVMFSAFSGSMYVLFGRGSYFMYIPFIFFIGKCIRLQKISLKRIFDYFFWGVYAFLSFIFLVYIGNYNNLFPFLMDPIISF